MKFDASKGAWVDELPQVLWAIYTTHRIVTRETYLSVACRVEVEFG